MDKTYLPSNQHLGPVLQAARTMGKPIRTALNRAGSVFMVANMVLNQANSPGIAKAYAIGLAAHLGSQLCKTSNRFVNFLASNAGCLGTNALLTAGAAASTFLSGGNTDLVGTLSCFSAANGVQSTIFGNILRFGNVAKNYALTACELCMTAGFGFLMHYSGASTREAGVAFGVNVLAAMARVNPFRLEMLRNIHPDVLYLDMLSVAAYTAQLAHTHGHDWVAASRVLAMVAITMLAGDRAKNSGFTPYLDIRENVGRIRNLLSPKPAKTLG